LYSTRESITIAVLLTHGFLHQVVVLGILDRVHRFSERRAVPIRLKKGTKNHMKTKKNNLALLLLIAGKRKAVRVKESRVPVIENGREYDNSCWRGAHLPCLEYISTLNADNTCCTRESPVNQSVRVLFIDKSSILLC
jgi:hypothetical protein